jgi:tetratricopeptide (TPR) repeat protein
VYEIEDLLQPFIGYMDLGMYREAGDELETLPAQFKDHPKVMFARMELLLETSRWEDGVQLGQSLCRLWPEEHEFHFRTAYCQHELKATPEARATLLRAPESIRATALYHYNMACYETQLGNLDEAKRLLKICFEKSREYRKGAQGDPDLKPLWPWLAKP